ncbi:hypothetical protein EVAR_43102_1 [Eumeta japonica]|uniref:Uncharacterized protein n=1 Tax=Eumeta variegata TaxID=151549 RepID=A0A4C1YK70_EUMVA|nr:hypothetical protein EVAR_43102_1 [Eumeta japonica]
MKAGKRYSLYAGKGLEYMGREIWTGPAVGDYRGPLKGDPKICDVEGRSRWSDRHLQKFCQRIQPIRYNRGGSIEKRHPWVAPSLPTVRPRRCKLSRSTAVHEMLGSTLDQGVCSHP